MHDPPRPGRSGPSRVARWLALAGALAIAVLLAALGLSGSGSKGGNRPASAGAADEDAPLHASGVEARPADLRETARTVGTLAANESVNIVPELSRRLVRVHVEEGARVEQERLLFELDDADLRAVQAELQARRRLAANTVERQRSLLAEDERALSGQDHERALADLAALDAQLRANQVTLAKTRIRAPFAGTIGLRRVSEGAWVTPETLLSTLQDRSRIKVDFTLPERHASLIAAGQEFRFRVEGRSEPFAARVLAVEPVIQAETRSLLVRGIADNPDASLFPGAFVAVEVPLVGVAEGVMVPAEALLPSAEGHSVFVLEEGRAELRPVEVGVRGEENVQILRGLAEGELVLRTNLLRLRPGVAVVLDPEGSG